MLSVFKIKQAIVNEELTLPKVKRPRIWKMRKFKTTSEFCIIEIRIYDYL
jgi:hypothetical protein